MQLERNLSEATNGNQPHREYSSPVQGLLTHTFSLSSNKVARGNVLHDNLSLPKTPMWNVSPNCRGDINK